MTVYRCPPETSVQSIGIQCNLLAVPPLTPFAKLPEKRDHQENSDTEEVDLTDLDTSFHISQQEALQVSMNITNILVMISVRVFIPCQVTYCRNAFQ